MSMYDLNPTKDPATSSSQKKPARKFPWAALIVILAVAVGFGLGAASWGKIDSWTNQFNISIPGIFAPSSPANTNADDQKNPPAYTPQTTQEDAVIGVVKNYSPAVVSIVITKNVPVYEQYYVSPFGGFIQIPQVRQKGTQSQEVGAGTGFIISGDGIVVTNKHVVSDSAATYTAFTPDGKKYSAKILALDPAEDLAIVKISGDSGQVFPSVKLGDSSSLQVGQSVIAIGNALGEFDNTVSVGVISGLQRSITAGGGGASETLSNLIQTDAAINEGNSGGPLLNLKGEVIGVNTATASGAQNVGFVLPINLAKRDIDQVQRTGKITYPYLGIYYTLVDSQIQLDNKLPADYGAWVTSPGTNQNGSNIDPIVAGSPAQKAGLKDGDIILEMNGEKITQDNSLTQIIEKFNPGDKVTLKVQRGNDVIDLDVTLGDRSQNQ